MSEFALRTYEKATSDQLLRGIAWYELARQQMVKLSVLTGFGLRVVAGVTAVLSPATAWERNLEDAEGIMTVDGYVPVSYGNNVAKAREIIKTGTTVSVSGNKVYSFFLNLTGDMNAVTVDRHMVRIFYPDVETKHISRYVQGKAKYGVCASAVRLASSRAGMLPAHFQAVTWLVQRES